MKPLLFAMLALPLLLVACERRVPTATVVVPAAESQPSTVAITLYVPVIASVALGIVGFWAVDVKPRGPVHEYVAPATSDAYSWIVWPGE